MSDKLAIIGHDSKARPNPMPNPAKPGPEPLLARPEAAPEATLSLARRRKTLRDG